MTFIKQAQALIIFAVLTLAPATIYAATTTDAYEPDNTFDNAIAIIPDTPQQHSIYPVNDQDWLKINLANTSTLSLTTDGVIDGDTLITLYDANSQEITSDDDSGNGFYSKLEITLGSGIYYAKITGIEEEELSNYNVVLTLSQPQQGDQYEADNSLSTATLLIPSSSQVHSIIPANTDEDWYKIINSQNSTMTLTTSGSNAQNDTTLAFYNVLGEEIASNDDFGNGLYSKILLSPLNPGTYYAKVSGFGKVDSYNIELTLLAQPSEATAYEVITLIMLLLF